MDAVAAGDAVVVVVAYIVYHPFPLHGAGTRSLVEACSVTRMISSVGGGGASVPVHTETRDGFDDDMPPATPAMM